MSRLIDLAKYQGVAVEKEIVVDAGERYTELLDGVRDKLNDEHPDIFLGSIFDKNVQDEAKDWIGVYIREWIKKNGMIDKYNTIDELIDSISYDILDISILKPLVEMPGVTDIFVDSPSEIYYDNYLEGRRKHKESFKSEEEMLFIMKKIASAAGKNLSAETPVVNAQIGNNRFNVTLGVGSKGIGSNHYINIRVHRDTQLTKEELIESGMVTQEAVDFITDVARCKKVAGIIGGPTGSGKSTALDALVLSSIEDWERQDLIQDENELRAKAKRPNQNVVELFTKVSSRKETEYTISRLIEDIALRNKPDRIIVGEIRKGEDGEKLLYAFETGHLGWTTAHAGNARGIIRRIAKMVMTTRPNSEVEEIEDDIFGVIDILIFIDLIKVGGVEKRRITEIVELYQDENFKNEFRHIFKYDTKEGKLIRLNPISPSLIDKMEKSEIPTDRWANL